MKPHAQFYLPPTPLLIYLPVILARKCYKYNFYNSSTTMPLPVSHHPAPPPPVIYLLTNDPHEEEQQREHHRRPFGGQYQTGAVEPPNAVIGLGGAGPQVPPLHTGIGGAGGVQHQLSHLRGEQDGEGVDVVLEGVVGDGMRSAGGVHPDVLQDLCHSIYFVPSVVRGYC